MSQFGHLESNCWILWANFLMRTKFLSHCGLIVDYMHQKCIAPHRASVHGFKLFKYIVLGAGVYIGCHQFDQSALAMILIHEFCLQVWDLIVHSDVRTVLHVQRNSITKQVCKS